MRVDIYGKIFLSTHIWKQDYLDDILFNYCSCLNIVLVTYITIYWKLLAVFPIFRSQTAFSDFNLFNFSFLFPLHQHNYQIMWQFYYERYSLFLFIFVVVLFLFLFFPNSSFLLQIQLKHFITRVVIFGLIS